MNAQEIIDMCSKLARKYNNPMAYDDLVSEGIVACYEKLEVKKGKDVYPLQLAFAAKRSMHDYINFGLAPVSIPKSDAARKVARGSEDTSGSYSEAGLRLLKFTLEGRVTEVDEQLQSEAPTQADDYEKMDYEAHVVTVAVTVLDLRELKLLQDRYFRDIPQQEIAEEMGVTSSTISRWEENMLHKLRSHLL